MKALSLTAVVVVLTLGLAVNAQEQDPMVDRLQAALDLSDEQTVAVGKILGEQAEQRRAMMQEARDTGDRRAVRDRMQAMMAATEEKLGKVLNEDQMAKYREMRAEMRGGQRGRAGVRAPGQGGRPQQQ